MTQIHKVSGDGINLGLFYILPHDIVINNAGYLLTDLSMYRRVNVTSNGTSMQLKHCAFMTAISWP